MSKDVKDEIVQKIQEAVRKGGNLETVVQTILDDSFEELSKEVAKE